MEYISVLFSLETLALLFAIAYFLKLIVLTNTKESSTRSLVKRSLLNQRVYHA